MKKYITENPKETKLLAKKLIKKFFGGGVWGLVGDLGSGKTVFVQGLAKALGIKKIVNSPTFVLMKIYAIRDSCLAGRQARFAIRQLVHIDAYRLNNYQELMDIGLWEYLGRKDTLVVIEWADKVPEIKKIPGYREIIFAPGKGENIRLIKIK